MVKNRVKWQLKAKKQFTNAKKFVILIELDTFCKGGGFSTPNFA